MVASKTAAGLVGGFLAVLLSPTGAAIAFPFIDASNQDSVPGGAPQGSELSSTDSTGLGNQLRLVNAHGPGNPSTWTIIPRLTLQEMFTDNALEVPSPRRADAITVIAPGISVLADTTRLRLTLDYQPNLLLHAVEGPLNVVTQQLNATGLITVVPDLAYVDVRALTGVQSRLAGLAAAGTVGAGSGITNAAGTPGYVAGAGQGLNVNNEVQTSSFGISPYMMRQFGDFGSGKLGISANASRSSSINGFIADPLPTGGGKNGSNLITTEEFAHFGTGQFLGRFQENIDIDVQQSRTQNGTQTAISGTVIGGVIIPGTTTTTVPAISYYSQRQSLTNQLSYALTRTFTILTSLGEQSIRYSGQRGPAISGLTWSVGFNYAPAPDRSLTMTYGHNNGVNSISANGYFAVGGRSSLTVSYTNTIGTQLENLQNQLNNSVVNVNGQLVNAITGGPNFVATNALGAQTGVYRVNTFNTSFSTQMLRDTLQASASWSIQTTVSPGTTETTEFIDPTTGQLIVLNQPISANGQSTDVKSITISWTHLLNPDLTLNSSASYSFVHSSGGQPPSSSLQTAVGLQYVMSASTYLTARYSFFDRFSRIPGYTLYENLLLLGLTKQF